MSVALDTYAEQLNERLARSRIPDYMRHGLREYVLGGQPVGDFLLAVLSNDLKESFVRADDTNITLIGEYVNFLYNNTPARCWGSPARVQAWIDHQGMYNSPRDPRRI